jgi:hypothetical protein
MNLPLNKDLSKGNFIGRVIRNEDPDFTGRCKVRVFGLMDDLEEEFLPWFSPANNSIFSSSRGGGSLSIPKVGAFVRVRFVNEDIYSGEYTCIQNVDPFLANTIKDDYIGTHVICYDADQELMIMFQPHRGLVLYYKESEINIAPDNKITISEPNNNSIITMANDVINIVSKNQINVTALKSANITSDVVNLEANSVNVGRGANTPAVDGNALVGVLEYLSKMISEKYPQTPGVPNTESFSSILSTSVKISK